KRDVESLLGCGAGRLRCEAAEYPAFHPGRSARLFLDDAAIGWLGEIHPRWAQQLDFSHAPVVFEIDAAAIGTRALPEPRELSRLPVVVRDLAVWVDSGVTYQAMLDTLENEIGRDSELGVVKDIKLFDVWRDKADSSAKSMALRFWFQGRESTLDDARIESCVRRLFA